MVLAPAPSATKTVENPENERHGRHDQPRRTARTELGSGAQLFGRNAGHVAKIGRDERQDAGAQKRQRSGEDGGRIG